MKKLRAVFAVLIFGCAVNVFGAEKRALENEYFRAILVIAQDIKPGDPDFEAYSGFTFWMDRGLIVVGVCRTSISVFIDEKIPLILRDQQNLEDLSEPGLLSAEKISYFATDDEAYKFVLTGKVIIKLRNGGSKSRLEKHIQERKKKFCPSDSA